MHNKFLRSTILVTFLLSLACVSLVCTSLVTDHWIESKPFRKRNPSESSGHINFGLLHGRKELDVSVGVRFHEIQVLKVLNEHPQILSWDLWCATLISIILMLSCSVSSAFLSLINTVIVPQYKLFGVFGIFTSNIFAIVLSIICSSTWYAQCQLKLYKNVLTEQDLDNFWTSEGATTLGYSFWLIIIVGVLHVINLLLLKWSTLKGGRKRQETLNPLEEKMVGAIMLY